MKEKIIKFSNINNAQEFISCADKCDFDIDIFYNHIALDGKSIMAVLSMDLSKPVKVKYNGENIKFERVLSNLAVNS